MQLIYVLEVNDAPMIWKILRTENPDLEISKKRFLGFYLKLGLAKHKLDQLLPKRA